MPLVVPITGPDAGRLVRRPAATVPSAAPPDEVALDAVIPGRAAMRELGAAPDRSDLRRKASAEVAGILSRETGVSYTTARERVDQARERVAARGDK